MNFKEIEVSRERADAGIDFIDTLKIAIDGIEGIKSFKEYKEAVEELISEMESEIADDIEKVEAYDLEEHEDEVRCLNEHEF